MVLAFLALLGRIILLGYERIVVKQLGDQADSEGAAFLFFAVATLFLLPFVFFSDAPESYGFLQYAVVSSFFYSIGFMLYVKSLSIGEASLVSPLYHFNIFFLLVLTVVFLGESFTIFKIVGSVLLVYGASLLNRQKNFLLSLKGLFKHKACLVMILCSVFLAVGRTIDGFAVQAVPPIVYAFSIYVGITFFISVYVLFTKKLGNALSLLKNKTRTAVTAGAVNSYSYLLMLFAFREIEVSVVEPASMLGMIVTIILAHFMLKEKIVDRLFAAAVMLAGAWLLFV